MLQSKLLKTAISACFIGIVSLAFIKPIEPIDKIVDALNNWTTSQPQEKIYLHTDKPYYALGDTIWFKAYVTVGSRHQLSALSGALYADLIDEKDSIERTLKLPVTSGVAKGNFILNDSLMYGNYRIRAYTRWMKNAGVDYYYDHTFPVVKGIDADVVARINYQDKVTNKNPGALATITYTNNNGEPISGQEVRYAIIKDKLPVWRNTAKTDALGKINILLPNALKGTYIAAYIKRGKNHTVTNTFAIKASFTQSDVQFFPESGNLINGIPSRIAFKAVAPDGSSIDIKGSVYDNANQQVATFKSDFAGMGRFDLLPGEGKTYTAKVSYPDGTEATLDLPKAQNAGFVLAVYNSFDSDTLAVRINASPSLYQTPQTVSLVVQSGGEMIYASEVKIIKPNTSVFIPKKDFPTGIAQFTLFNSSGIPLNERVAFVRSSDLMQVKLSTLKSTFNTRERVEVSADVKDSKGAFTAGSFSAAVINESKVPEDENDESTILSNILLSSDIKGYVEKPNHYFINPGKETDEQLDNLMLTQGFRRFVWKDLLSGAIKPAEYKAEKLNTEISGRLLTLGHKTVAGGKIILFSKKSNVLQDTVTDANGRFSFTNLVLSDSLDFSVQGRTVKNGKKVQILLDKQFFQGATPNKNVLDVNNNIAESKKDFITSSKKEIEELERKGKLNQVQHLATVNIKGKKKADSGLQGVYSVPEAQIDQTFKLDHGDNCDNLMLCLKDKLPGVYFQPWGTISYYPYAHGGISESLKPMKLFINGDTVGNEDLHDLMEGTIIKPSEVVKVQVVISSMQARYYLTRDELLPALLIFTKGYFSAGAYHPEIATVSPRGFNHVKEFYSPRYDAPDVNKEPDLRSTIYWNPNLRASADGKLKFDFFNADNKGTYKVILEGINPAGELARQVYRYKVE